MTTIKSKNVQCVIVVKTSVSGFDVTTIYTSIHVLGHEIIKCYNIQLQEPQSHFLHKNM